MAAVCQHPTQGPSISLQLAQVGLLKLNNVLLFFDFLILFFRNGYTDLALEKVVTTGFAREEKVIENRADYISTVFLVALLTYIDNLILSHCWGMEQYTSKASFV